MKLSTRGRYAVMAMADLAGQEDGLPVALSEIAQRQHISLAYLEQLFGRLRKHDLLKSTRGPGGGYWLARAASKIFISDIILAVDEPMTITRCAEFTEQGCVGNGRCITHDLWAELGRHLHLFLSSVTLADVVGKKVRGLADRLPSAPEIFNQAAAKTA